MQPNQILLEKLSNIESLIKANNQPLTLQEACKYLDVTQSQLYKLTHLNLIPHYKPGGKKIYFNKLELNNWIYKNKKLTADEIEQKAINYVNSNEVQLW